jgi:hypothetical protein
VGLDEGVPGVQQHDARAAPQVLEDEVHVRDCGRLRDYRVQGTGRVAEALSDHAVLANGRREDHVDLKPCRLGRGYSPVNLGPGERCRHAEEGDHVDVRIEVVEGGHRHPVGGVRSADVPLGHSVGNETLVGEG